jgi:hypothetical protein
MIPITPDHKFDIANRQVLPGFVADMLPTRNFLKNQKSEPPRGN